MKTERFETAPLGEPLDRLAPFSWHNAPHLCEPAHGCGDYHRAWSLVRWLDLSGQPPAGQPFFAHWLAKLNASGRRRILVSGGADAGLTALVLDIFRGFAQVPDLCFVDQCETPVRQNRLLAEHHGVLMSAHKGNILDYDAKPFDVILAHSFLYFFSEEDRAALMRQWFRLLAPGGALLVSNVVHPHPHAERPARDPEQIAARARLLARQLAKMGWSTAACEEATGVLTRFWLTPVSKPPYPTQSGIEQLAKAAGFDVLSSVCQPVSAASGGPLSVQRRTDTTVRHRLELVARRPG
jgi:SAM-dependent methyltransferase